MKQTMGLALIVAGCICTGMDCQGNTPAPAMLPSGAYAGPVVIRTSGTFNGVEEPPNTRASYRVVDFVDGAVRVIRIAPDKNGPFDCWFPDPGNERTVFVESQGIELATEETIIERDSLQARYVVQSTVQSTTGGVMLTGEGTVGVSIESNGLNFRDHQSLVSGGTNITIEVEGTLSLIGDVGAVPTPTGMNGLWTNTFTAGGVDGMEIRGLKVTLYADAQGIQSVADSEPVIGGNGPGTNVLIEFLATTVFQSDPEPRLYTIRFQGTVQPDGTIVGQTRFTASGVQERVLDSTLERIPSTPC